MDRRQSRTNQILRMKIEIMFCYLSRKTGKESKPKMAKCKCKILIEKIT